MHYDAFGNWHDLNIAVILFRHHLVLICIQTENMVNLREPMIWLSMIWIFIFDAISAYKAGFEISDRDG